MMENRYRKLTERIHTPAGLNDQVLFEARRRTAEAAPCRERQGWGRPRTKTAFTAASAPRNWTRVLLRTAVCAVCALAPERVVYVSCNPQTQRRDVDLLVRQGYELDTLAVVDLFPQTKHAETVATLVRTRA